MMHPFRLLSVACLLSASSVAASEVPLRQAAVQDAVAMVSPSVVQIETVGGSDEVDGAAIGRGPTTGLVVDAEGHLVSSSINFAHSPSGILVRFSDGQRRPAQLVATDHNCKIALLKIDGDSGFPAPRFVEPGRVRVGQWAIAVGRAFDASHPNVAVGIVSALDRIWGKAVQTDAAVSPNNYGGPLINLQGEIVGLLVPMSPMSDDEMAGVDWYDSGIGFAVSASHLLQSVSRLKAGEDLYAGRFGMTLKKSVAMSGPAVVSSVIPNSPAEEAGLEKGDRIVRIGQKNIARSAQVKYELAALYAGDMLDMLVRRGDATLECKATLVARLEPYRCPTLGILAERGMASEPGVTLRLPVPDGPAARAGILPGDRIVALDGEPVADIEALRSRIARRKPAEAIVLDVVREAASRKVDVVLASAATTLPETLAAPAIDPEADAGREVALTLPQWKNEIKAYLPRAYSPDGWHGLLVWMRSVADDQGGFGLWRSHADGRGLIVVLVEPSSTRGWESGEVELVRDVVELCRKRFSVDADRVVVGGQAGGGGLAYRAATLAREELRGCAVFDAEISGPPLTDQPDNRFGLLIGHTDKGRLAERLDQAAEVLREGGLPVVVVSRDGAADRLADRDAAAISRWIDLLDQI